MEFFKDEAMPKDPPLHTGVLQTETNVLKIVFEWILWYNSGRIGLKLSNKREAFSKCYRTSRSI